MKIHNDVKQMYEKYYGKMVDISPNDNAFLEQLSTMIYSFEKTLKRFIDGNNQIE